MNDLKFFEIIKLNKELASSLKTDIYKISLISNVIINQLKEIIEYNLRLEGINAVANTGDYDNIIQDSIKFNKNNLVLVFWELCNLSEGIYYSIDSYNEVQLKEFIDYKKAEIDLVINTTEGKQSIEDSSSIRQSALRTKTFCTTTMFGAFAVMEALKTDEDDWVYTPLQEIN